MTPEEFEELKTGEQKEIDVRFYLLAADFRASNRTDAVFHTHASLSLKLVTSVPLYGESPQQGFDRRMREYCQSAAHQFRTPLIFTPEV